ncbi:MAG: aspartate kinase [Raineya sp.]|jgi:aspartate kinase|nr:aspartate kinase [Raineya sp.]
MLSVEKIGGTSMSSFDQVLQNIILFDSNQIYNRIYIVSAYAGVTNWLLEDKKTQAPGIYHHFIQSRNFHKQLEELTLRLKELNKKYISLGLNILEANHFIETRIQEAQRYLDSLADVLASGYLVKENIFQAAREILASIGESHSAFNAVNILQNKGYHATFVDLSGFQDSEALTIDQRIQKTLSTIDFSKTICIVTGYTKGTEGIMREFDRGYSEVTFSKVAVAVQADEAIIHKEYHLSSADPNIVGVENCVPVGFTNYDVADQLADVGMEAIHPKAAKPLEINGINLRIKNTFEPAHPGTLITKSYVCPDSRIEIITGSEKVMILDIHDPMMVGSVGYDLKIMQDLERFGVSYIFKTTSANSISMVIWEKDFKDELLDILKSKYETVTSRKVAIICLIGTNINQPGMLARTAQTLADNKINILSIGCAMRQVNIQLVIEKEYFKSAIQALNKEFVK